MQVTIRDIKIVCTRPLDSNLAVVKVETSESGLYGLGCATLPFRVEAVAAMVEKNLRPLLIGRDVSRIEEIWNVMHFSSYWRNGPVVNNAIAGVDMALWDIKGKMAGMPLYDLLGGKYREAVPVYRYAQDRDLYKIAEKVNLLMQEGVRYIRLRWDIQEENPVRKNAPKNSGDGLYWDPADYCRNVVKLFRFVRDQVGENVELCHDVHERVPPTKAMWLAKNLEPFHPYFIEDLVAPNQYEYLRHIRSQSCVPLAIGELFNNPLEFETLITQRLIDYMRAHMTHLGGITPAKKLAVLCEHFGIQVSWHIPPNASPVTHAAAMHFGMALKNTEAQEWPEMPPILYELFPGAPVVKGGYAYVSDKPGLGIEMIEEKCKKYPCKNVRIKRLELRYPDGSVQMP